jgi:hypothetical protein
MVLVVVVVVAALKTKVLLAVALMWQKLNIACHIPCCGG